jgi:predicted dehydrogenase
MVKEMTSDQIGIAFFGFGYWGGNYVRVIRELPNAWDVVVCDQRDERLKEAERRFSGLSLTTSVDEALADDRVQAAIICTNARAHFDIARRCLLAGKHVLVEKPITTTTEEAEELINLAESRGLTLMVGHTFLYNEGIRKVKEYVDQHRLGQVYYLYAVRTNMGPIRQDVNALWDLATHDVSIFNYLMDDIPKWVNAVGMRVLKNPNEDVGFITLGYRNGIIGHIHVSWADPNKVRQVVVVGSEKRVLFNDLEPMERVRVFEKGVEPVMGDEESSFSEYQFVMRDGDVISPRIPFGEPLKNQCIHFLDCVQEGKPPLSHARSGLDVVRVMQAIDESIAKHGMQIEVK